MPRTTDHEYLQRHRDLHKVWTHFPEAFMVLKPQDQWRVHAYYQTLSNTSDTELLATRDRLTREQSSLPQAAGKVYHRLELCFLTASECSQGDEERFTAALMALAPKRRRRQESRVQVYGIARPEPDAELLARTLLHLVEEQLDAMEEDLDRAA